MQMIAFSEFVRNSRLFWRACLGALTLVFSLAVVVMLDQSVAYEVFQDGKQLRARGAFSHWVPIPSDGRIYSIREMLNAVIGLSPDSSLILILCGVLSLIGLLWWLHETSRRNIESSRRDGIGALVLLAVLPLFALTIVCIVVYAFLERM